MKHFLLFLSVAILGFRETATAATYCLLDPGPFQGFVLGGSITTDGTLGLISDANILSWDITASDGIDTLNFNSGLTNHEVRTYGTSLNATSTSLFLPEGSVLVILFNRPGRDLFLQWERRLSSGIPLNRFNMNDDSIPRQYFRINSYFTTSSYALAAVPEPGSLMITVWGGAFLCFTRRRIKERANP